MESICSSGIGRCAGATGIGELQVLFFVDISEKIGYIDSDRRGEDVRLLLEDTHANDPVFFMPSGGLQGSLHFRHLGGILYLDFFAVVCYTPNRTVTVFPHRQLEPIKGEPVVGSFLFPGLTFADFLYILLLSSVSPLPYPTSVGTRYCDTLFFFFQG